MAGRMPALLGGQIGRPRVLVLSANPLWSARSDARDFGLAPATRDGRGGKRKFPGLVSSVV